MAVLTEESFVELVQKAEKDAEQNINAYKIRLALFALVGYAVIFTVLVLLLALVGGIIAIALISSSLAILLIKKKLIFVILLAIWTFLKALWIKFDPPEGYTLKRKEYPELFAEIDDLTKALDALKIHQVILDERLNAAVIQHPKFGVLGGQQNTLFLGLQLLLALSPQEMRSVLAHEFGHISGNHSSFSGWIYRIRLTWHRVMVTFESSGSVGALLMRCFFNWYAPRFSAYSFALARNNEYEADKVSAKLTSPDIAAKALVNVHATAPYIEEKFWNEYFKKAEDMPKPPHGPYEGLAKFLKNTPLTREELAERINKELEVKTHYSDTHPSLKDRVNAISSGDVMPDSFETNTAEIWLGKKYQYVLYRFDRSWMRENQENWKNRHEYVTHAKKTLEEFKDKPLDELSDEELWNFAGWTSEFNSDEAALPLYRSFQKRDPDSVGAAYCIGRTLISQKDEEALSHLMVAFNSPDTIEDAAQWGYHFLKQQGKDEEADNWWKEALTLNQVYQEAYAEREQVSPDDEYGQPVINDDLFDKIMMTLSEHRNAGSAWLAQKVLKHDNGDPVYVVTFRPKGFYWSFEEVMKKVAGTMKVDANVFVVSLWGDTSKLGKKIKRSGIKII